MSDDPRAIERRTCAKCNRPTVRCTQVTQHLLRGLLPIGRTYAHACDACKVVFETESPLRSVYNLMFGLASLAFGALGVAFLVAWVLDFFAGRVGMPSLYEAFTGAIIVMLFGVGLYLPMRTVTRTVSLLRNPVAR